MSVHSEVFKNIGKARGLAKQRVLREHQFEIVREILKYCYDPFKRYYITRTEIKGMGDNELGPTSFNILDKLSRRELSGDMACAIVEAHLWHLTSEDAEIFKNILKKDMRIGLAAKSINAVFPGLIPVFDVMLAQKWEDRHYHGGLLMSLKIDGLRGVNDHGLRTRNGHEILGLDHLVQYVGNFSLDGELLDPTKHFQKSSGDTRSHNISPGVRYYIFDIPDHPGPLHERLADLESLYKVNRWDDPDCPIELVKHALVKSKDHIQSNFIKALNAGYEGLVIKPQDSPYERKRSKNWLKLKNELSEDLPVVGFFEGEGKYEGMLGGIIVERKNGVHVRVGSGFSDIQRHNLWQQRTIFYNLDRKIAEIKYHEETPDGSLRHPIFKKWRTDK